MYSWKTAISLALIVSSLLLADNQKISELSAVTQLDKDDLLLVSEDDGDGTFTSKKLTLLDYASVFDVRLYGATGDGVTMDTAAFQAAGVAAAAAGAVLYVPHGVYRVNGVLVNDLHIAIKGAGPGRSIIDCNDYTGSLFVLNDNSTVEGLEIRGDDQSYGAVAFDEGTYTYLCRFNNLRFRNIGACIDLERCWGTSIRDVFAIGVGKGLELSKANGCTLDQIYINGHYDAAVRIQDSRAVTATNLIIENGAAASASRLILQGVECATIDGVYFEGNLGLNARDVFLGVKSGIFCREIMIQNVWHNTGGTTAPTVAPIYVSGTYGLTLKGWHWNTPGVGYFPSYIESASGVNYVTIEGWQLYGTSPLVPLCDDLRALRVVGPLGRISSEFLTTVDSGGRYPRVDGWVNDNEIHAIGTWRKPQKSLATVTAIYTIDLDDDASTDDYQFDDDADNTTEQVITLTSALPAYAELVSCQLRCFETVTGSATMSIDVGTTSGGDEILAAANTDSANDINTTAATAGPVLAATNAARSVYVNATPGANWNTLDAGRWVLMLTYIDYGAVYTQRGP